MEIGSEFWLEDIPEKTAAQLPSYLKKYENLVLTASGSGAIMLLLQHIQPERKTVLLPAYICESIILPFLKMGYDCNYYEVDENLAPDIESIRSFENVGVFLHLGYYGFPTNSNLNEVLKSFKENSTLIIEDVTHSLFSNYESSKFNDYYIGSIRKWFGIPSGGFLASTDRKYDTLLEENSSFSDKRLEALLSKREYMKTNKIEFKNIALRQFAEAESILDEDFSPYRIDTLSTEIISTLNVEELIMKRKENYFTLCNGVKYIDTLEPLIEKVDGDICPLFFPVLIKKEDRSRIRSKLAEQGVYCPIHWPLPQQLKSETLKTTMNIYTRILSIPCDQRYDTKDMKRIISVLQSIQLD